MHSRPLLTAPDRAPRSHCTHARSHSEPGKCPAHAEAQLRLLLSGLLPPMSRGSGRLDRSPPGHGVRPRWEQELDGGSELGPGTGGRVACVLWGQTSGCQLGLRALPSPASPHPSRPAQAQLLACPPPFFAQFLGGVGSGLIVLACPGRDHPDMGELLQSLRVCNPPKAEALGRPPCVQGLNSLLPSPAWR